MSQRLTVAVPILASTILLLAKNAHPAKTGGAGGNDIHVLMIKRHSKARFMPSIYVFPGGGIDVADYVAAGDYVSKHYGVQSPLTSEMFAAPSSFMAVKTNPSPAESETEAWACRIGALRELAEETACVLQRDGTICTVDEWQEKSTTAGAAASSSALYDVDSTPLLRPVGRWVTPRHLEYRYATYFYAALVKGGSEASPETSTTVQEVPLTPQASEVSELLWTSPLEALHRHECTSDTFSLAPPTFLLLHALARQPSYDALAEMWATSLPSPATTSTATEATCVGTLPYSSVLPCVEPWSRMIQGSKRIEDLILPENYFCEKGWSEPAGVYRFCGKAFDGQTHEIRMWVGSYWAQKVGDASVDVTKLAVQKLAH